MWAGLSWQLLIQEVGLLRRHSVTTHYCAQHFSQSVHILAHNCTQSVPILTQNTTHSQFGPLESIRVFPGKTFAFVNFGAAADAINAKATLDSQVGPVSLRVCVCCTTLFYVCCLTILLISLSIA